MNMTEQIFSLIPFPNSNIPDIQINGRVRRENGQLGIQYTITGATEKILWSEPSASPMRKDGLWSATCFEFFMALPGDPQYWEFNVSPSGDWNVYHMNAYRRVGFSQETSIQQLRFDVKNEPGLVSLNTSVDVSLLVSEGQSLQLGISCVVQSIDHDESYWALVHPHPTPDFHLRQSFILQI